MLSAQPSSPYLSIRHLFLCSNLSHTYRCRVFIPKSIQKLQLVALSTPWIHRFFFEVILLCRGVQPMLIYPVVVDWFIDSVLGILQPATMIHCNPQPTGLAPKRTQSSHNGPVAIVHSDVLRAFVQVLRAFDFFQNYAGIDAAHSSTSFTTS